MCPAGMWPWRISGCRAIRGAAAELCEASMMSGWMVGRGVCSEVLEAGYNRYTVCGVTAFTVSSQCLVQCLHTILDTYYRYRDWRSNCFHLSWLWEEERGYHLLDIHSLMNVNTEQFSDIFNEHCHRFEYFSFNCLQFHFHINDWKTAENHLWSYWENCPKLAQIICKT